MTTPLEVRQERTLVAPEFLNLGSRQAFRRQAVDMLDGMRPGEGRLVIDVGRVRMIDSTGVYALIAVHRHARESRQVVRLRGVGMELRTLLIRTHLLGLFEVE